MNERNKVRAWSIRKHWVGTEERRLNYVSQVRSKIGYYPTGQYRQNVRFLPDRNNLPVSWTKKKKILSVNFTDFGPD